MRHPTPTTTHLSWPPLKVNVACDLSDEAYDLWMMGPVTRRIEPAGRILYGMYVLYHAYYFLSLQYAHSGMPYHTIPNSGVTIHTQRETSRLL